MKKTNLILFALALGALAAPRQSAAQAFNSGSDGSYGPLIVGSNITLNIPANGIFNCTTITVSNGFTLKFNRNALNTPVYLLATGDVTINGTIDVSGKRGTSNPPVGGEGGPGGFDGGKPGSASVPPGAGYGPGAGKGGNNDTSVSGAGAGAYGTVLTGTGQSTNKGSIYGSPLLVPLVGGSGGGGSAGTPGTGGGGGGGAILIASSTRIDVGANGHVYAFGAGQGSPYNGGSGGGIRLVAPIVSGNGQLHVGSENGGGEGRIRVDTLNRAGMGFSFIPTSTTSIGSMMFIFPSPNPRLDILQAADTNIPEGAAGPVFVQLPFGSTTNRTVTVQARDFNALVPINVVLTPDNGVPQTYAAQIDNRTVNPAQVIVNIALPVNVQVAINAWNR
jgi:hypothetical protein